MARYLSQTPPLSQYPSLGLQPAVAVGGDGSSRSSSSINKTLPPDPPQSHSLTSGLSTPSPRTVPANGITSSTPRPTPPTPTLAPRVPPKDSIAVDIAVAGDNGYDGGQTQDETSPISTTTSSIIDSYATSTAEQRPWADASTPLAAPLVRSRHTLNLQQDRLRYLETYGTVGDAGDGERINRHDAGYYQEMQRKKTLAYSFDATTAEGDDGDDNNSRQVVGASGRLRCAEDLAIVYRNTLLPSPFVQTGDDQRNGDGNGNETVLTPLIPEAPKLSRSWSFFVPPRPDISKGPSPAASFQEQVEPRLTTSDTLAAPRRELGSHSSWEKGDDAEQMYATQAAAAHPPFDTSIDDVYREPQPSRRGHNRSPRVESIDTQEHALPDTPTTHFSDDSHDGTSQKLGPRLRKARPQSRVESTTNSMVRSLTPSTTMSKFSGHSRVGSLGTGGTSQGDGSWRPLSQHDKYLANDQSVCMNREREAVVNAGTVPGERDKNNDPRSPLAARLASGLRLSLKPTVADDPSRRPIKKSSTWAATGAAPLTVTRVKADGSPGVTSPGPEIGWFSRVRGRKKVEAERERWRESLRRSIKVVPARSEDLHALVVTDEMRARSALGGGNVLLNPF